MRSYQIIVQWSLVLLSMLHGVSSESPGNTSLVQTAADPSSCPRRAACDSLTLRLRGELREEREETNHWRESWDDIMRAGTGNWEGLSSGYTGSWAGLPQRKYRERKRDGHTASPGHRMVSCQAQARFLLEREQRSRGDSSEQIFLNTRGLALSCRSQPRLF